MHPRLVASNGRVAHVSLKGHVRAEKFVSGTKMQISEPVAGLLRSAGGSLDRQMLFGAGFLELEPDAKSGFSFGASESDGYVGYIRTRDLVLAAPNTHRVSGLASHIFEAPDLKSPARMGLSFASELGVKAIKDGYAILTGGGFVPAQHLITLEQSAPDFVAVIEMFLGIPYLWGGNSSWGMDCSGMVQLALAAANQTCPRDADMQQEELGHYLAADAALGRGDLIFWRGHVGIMRDAKTLIHANAFHMAVASESLDQAAGRISASGGGVITARKRI